MMWGYSVTGMGWWMFPLIIDLACSDWSRGLGVDPFSRVLHTDSIRPPDGYNEHRTIRDGDPTPALCSWGD